jgi:hypothetical protein
MSFEPMSSNGSKYESLSDLEKSYIKLTMVRVAERVEKMTETIQDTMVYNLVPEMVCILLNVNSVGRLQVIKKEMNGVANVTLIISLKDWSTEVRLAHGVSWKLVTQLMRKSYVVIDEMGLTLKWSLYEPWAVEEMELHYESDRMTETQMARCIGEVRTRMKRPQPVIGWGIWCPGIDLPKVIYPPTMIGGLGDATKINLTDSVDIGIIASALNNSGVRFVAPKELRVCSQLSVSFEPEVKDGVSEGESEQFEVKVHVTDDSEGDIPERAKSDFFDLLMAPTGYRAAFSSSNSPGSSVSFGQRSGNLNWSSDESIDPSSAKFKRVANTVMGLVQGRDQWDQQFSARTLAKMVKRQLGRKTRINKTSMGRVLDVMVATGAYGLRKEDAGGRVVYELC